MSIDALLQLMRTCSLAQVRKQLIKIKKAKGLDLFVIQAFYEAASKQPK